MNSNEIRQAFLDFFASKQHKTVSSAPMVIKDDPTLMFTNAGMNQFKDIFLGNSPIKYKRIANSQKCLRVSGKHNDLEEVGHDTYHHTMFEMLGNWSFGDYFKEDAINWAWELLTEVYKLPKERLYASVFEGSDEDKLGRDDKAAALWEKFLPLEQIINGNKKDNFWEMGDTGPCGPCSEIHVDLRSEEERKLVAGRDLVNNDHPQVIEIWNLVFMQYNRKADGSLEALPHQHVDTGMGFERLCMAMQGKTSNYDTDVFQPIIQAIAKMSAKEYGKNAEVDIALRVIADHIRTIAFAITDGQLPSNNKAGYVIRRILRRAVRYGYTFLGFKEPFMYRLVQVLIEVMGNHFPELVKQQELIEKVVMEEENSFLRTLENGIRLLDQIIDKTKSEDYKVVSGKVAFELYDTYGFPLDLTELILKENNLVINRREFNEEMEAQKNRSRSATAVETGDWVEILKDDVEEFIGYDYLSADVRITRYRKISSKDKDLFQLVFNITPFYGESGGQIGDTGYLEANGEKISIVDTKKENGLIVHFTKELPKDPTVVFKAKVNESKRTLIANNHTATHLMHHALRSILGEHVEQKGSLVTADHLRFDFSHFQKLSEEEIAKVEEIVNQKIRENASIEIKNNIPMAEAVDLGAMALFGEKYGDLVRVIKFNDSVELCGGTHVQATGQIGYFKITSESAIAAGVRRIEAITAVRAEQFITDKLNTLKDIERIFKSNQNLIKNITDLMNENSDLKKDLDGFMKDRLKVIKNNLKGNISITKDINIIAEPISTASAGDIKDIAFQLKGELENLVFISGADLDGKANITIMFSDNLVKEYDLNAGAIIREAAKEIQGGGGGQPFFASAGGKDSKGLEKAIEVAKKMVLHKIEG
ncbi:alanine--tRNA ligase [Labilibaculum filiforme]|uniref:Alanine--tRNA ligase n=1 Tax=Labilibaculum filiforme TaxID=1940526 RepID=A0A2N3I5J9_9BACT|nr:alanine--tRNA ligase [Labilibaculum filiforme]PKQ65576.1 alanine--tRNA ligase [Labilibaculum filiforme]